VASDETKITQDEVLAQLINKSAGPDLIHPKVLFEFSDGRF